MGIVYKITNQVNQKSYIGQTSRTLNQRKQEHVNNAKKSKKPASLLYKAIRKYGVENFEWTLLEECSNDILDDREKFYIKKLRTHSSKGGYNLTEGGSTIFGASGRYHYLKKKSSKEYKGWIKKYRVGKNNPNYNNGKAISGNNHYLNKLTKKEKQKWIDSHLGGDNNYQKKLSKKQLKDKCWINKLSEEEKSEWVKKNLSGKNNPFSVAYNKNPQKYADKIDKLAKKYVIIFPDGTERVVKNLHKFCREYKEAKLWNQNLRAVANGKVKHCKNHKCRFYDEKTDSKIPDY